MDKELTLDSKFEMYFDWWLEDLKNLGLVKDISKPMTMSIKESSIIVTKQKYLKKESIFKTVPLFPPIVYTADRKALFSEKLLNKLFGYGTFVGGFYELVDDPNLTKGNVYQNTLFYCFDGAKQEDGFYELYFDVKPPASISQFTGKLGSSRDFKYIQTLLFEKKGIYLNKVIPIGMRNCLFNKTFVPSRYFYTDKGGKLRKRTNKLNWRSVNEYLEQKNINI